MGINKVILVGNVGKDPDVQYIKDDLPVAKFSLATSETHKDKNGEKVTTVEWHNIVIWRGLAKIVEQYVKKGDPLYIEGKITYKEYEKDGQKKYFTEIVASDLQMLGGSKGKTQDNQVEKQDEQTNSAIQTESSHVEENDDLPF